MQIVVALGVALALACGVCAAAIPLIISLSHKREWYDMPNARKIHTGPIPRLGGVGIFLGFMAGSLVVPLLFTRLYPSLDLALSGRHAFLFLAFAVICSLGLVDDFHNLRALLKLILQIVAAALVTVGGFTISRFSFPGLGTVSLGVFSYPLTVLWLVAISNALNLVDGVDGLAGGIAVIAALSLGLLCLVDGGGVPAVMSFSLVGAALGFLLFNFPPARIFMGDSGSLAIGFILATLPLMIAPGRTEIRDMTAPATVLLLPILDTASAIVRRLRGRRPVYSPDKDHIHHKLLAVGLSKNQLLVIVYSACALFGIAAIVSRRLAAWPALFLLVGIWLAAVGGYAALTRIRQGK
jgi:UDP-GlcNAc:undecaprenyl-phosphate/decaprenyl-phosphate GlcNAc-1-phosphate transferase